MSFIEWDDKYSVNIPKIDEQHKKFMSIINELHDALMIDQDPKDVIERIVNELVDYTDYHFKTEEHWFEQHNYPDKEAHKDQHDKLRNQVYKLRDDFVANRIEIDLSVLSFLTEWLVEHILTSDMEYSPYLISKNV
jgi:hemerythrin-like metal-binding protein